MISGKKNSLDLVFEQRFVPHRLQQSLHLVELLLAHPGLHLDLTDDPLKSLQPAVGEGRG